MTEPEPILSFDIGGTKLAVGVAQPSGRLLAHRAWPTNRDSTPAQLLDELVIAGRELVSGRGVGVAALGISYGGPVDYARGVTITCHHLRGWEEVPLLEMAAVRTGLRVAMDNDANAAGLAEYYFGAGRGFPDMVYLTVSSGVGGGVIIGGRVHRGVSTMAGEIGHTVIDPNGPECTCGKRGCVEAFASGWSIARRAEEALAAAREPSALRKGEASAQAVAAAAAQGDALALRLMAETADYLGRGIAAAVNLLNPGLVVVGGGVAKAGEVLFGPLRETVAKYGVAEAVAAAGVVPAELGDHTGLLGGVAVAREMLAR